MKNDLWFKSIDCSSLSVYKYKSVADETVVASLEIKMKSSIQALMERIQSLPAKGTENIRVGPKASRILLSFSCADGSTQKIEVINKKFKTPSTAFIDGKNPEEENLYRDLDGLLEPDLNKRILKIQDHPVKFKDFTITFRGEEHTPQPANGPTVGSTTRTSFDIRTQSSSNIISLKIFSGQIAPQPQSFVVGKATYQLLAFQNQKNERLSPIYFEVSR